MIVHDTIIFGALYSTKGEFGAKSEFAFFCYLAWETLSLPHEAD